MVSGGLDAKQSENIQGCPLMGTFKGRWPGVYDMVLAFVAFVVVELVRLKAPVITSATWYYYILLLFACFGVATVIATLRGVVSNMVTRMRFCALHFLVKRVATLVAQAEYGKAKHEAALLKVKFRKLEVHVDLENLETDRARELLAELRDCTGRWGGLPTAKELSGR